MTRPRTPAAVLTALALTSVLAACTSSGSGSGKHNASGVASSGAPGTSSAASSGAASFGASTSTRNGAGPTGTTTTIPAPAKPLRTMTVQGAHATFTIKVWVQVQSPSCTGHAYGATVVGFLRQHPCTALTRLLATTTVGKKAVGLAESTVIFAGTAAAATTTATNFTLLFDKQGAGNITDLFREGRRLPSGPTSIPASDASNARNDGRTATIVDAWYLKGSTPQDDPALSEMTEALAS